MREPATHAIPEHLSGSDYSGSLVERSNRDAWRETFAEGEDQWWTEVSGGHGTFAIVVKIDALPDDAREFINALDGYPIADDDHHSELEMQAQSEAWESWAASDFRRALEKRMGNDADLSSVDGQALFEIFCEAQDTSNEYWVNEQGDSMYINIDRIIARGVTDEQIETLRTLASKAE